MRITFKLEKNTDNGQAPEDRFYIIFEKGVTKEQILALFKQKGFQAPELIEQEGTLHAFINKRIPEPALVAAAKEAGTPLLEDYSIVQALDILKTKLGSEFELDSKAIDTLNQSRIFAKQALDNLKGIFGDALTTDYYSAFDGANIGLDEAYINNLKQFIPKKTPEPSKPIVTNSTGSVDTQQKTKEKQSYFLSYGGAGGKWWAKDEATIKMLD